MCLNFRHLNQDLQDDGVLVEEKWDFSRIPLKITYFKVCSHDEDLFIRSFYVLKPSGLC